MIHVKLMRAKHETQNKIIFMKPMSEESVL